MAKRFNLWEKLIIENEEIDDEMVDDELESSELEDEMGDNLNDLMVNFILNLPADSVPEDMKSTYDTLIAEIGDDYLGGEEGIEGDEDYPVDDDPDAPMVSDDELKQEGDDEEEMEEDDDYELEEAKSTWTPRKEEQYRKISQAVTDSAKELDKCKEPKDSKEFQKLAKKWKQAVKKAEQFGEKNF